MISVPLRSRRRKRAQAAQKFQHLVPAFPLLFTGVATLREHPQGLPLALGLFEVATSVLLIVTMMREIRALRRASASEGDAHRHHAHGIAWFDVFAAGVLAAEVLQHWHETHHWRRPVILTALVTLALGLFHGRLESWAEDKRALKVSDEGISLGRRPFGVFRAAWKDVREIDVGPRYGVIRLRDGGRRRIDFADCENPEPVRSALLQAQALVSRPVDD